MSTDSILRPNKTVRFRVVVTSTAEVEMELTSQPDGGTFIQAKLQDEGLVVSVAADFRKDLDLPREVRDYLAYSAGHTMSEAVLHRLDKKLRTQGEEQLPSFSNGGTVGSA